MPDYFTAVEPLTRDPDLFALDLVQGSDKLGNQIERRPTSPFAIRELGQGRFAESVTIGNLWKPPVLGLKA